MARSIIAVIAGYLAFASGLTFIVIHLFIEPVVPIGPLWLVLLLVTLAVFGVLLGGLVQLISGTTSPIPARITAGLATALMVANIVLDIATEPVWFKLCVIGITIPLILVTQRELARRITADRP